MCGKISFETDLKVSFFDVNLYKFFGEIVRNLIGFTILFYRNSGIIKLVCKLRYYFSGTNLINDMCFLPRVFQFFKRFKKSLHEKECPRCQLLNGIKIFICTCVSDVTTLNRNVSTANKHVC